jgi:hypothetical protein
MSLRDKLSQPQVPKESVPILRNYSFWVVRTSMPAAAIESSVRNEIRGLDANVPASLRTTMPERGKAFQREIRSSDFEARNKFKCSNDRRNKREAFRTFFLEHLVIVSDFDIRISSLGFGSITSSPRRVRPLADARRWIKATALKFPSLPDRERRRGCWRSSACHP